MTITTHTSHGPREADVEGLATLVGDGGLARRVARVAGSRPALSAHEPPGI